MASRQGRFGLKGLKEAPGFLLGGDFSLGGGVSSGASSLEEDISSKWKEADDSEVECMHRTVRVSVGLPDVPPCCFTELACLDSPSRVRLPCLEVLQVEEFLTACSLDSVSDSFTKEEALGVALERSLEWTASAQHRSSLPPPHCQRLPAVMRDLLMQTSSRTLHKHVYELEPEGHLARLRPAGELLLSLLEVCLNIRSKEGEEKASPPAGANPKETEGEGACSSKAALEGPRQREGGEADSLSNAVEELRKRLPGDFQAQDLRLFLKRLRAESEALAALRGIARLQPGAALLALEQLMQQPELQHLPSFRAPPCEVLREAFYDCLLRCFSLALAHSFSDAQQQDSGCMRLVDRCRDALRRAGLWQICRDELEATPSRACHSSRCKETSYRCSAGDSRESSASTLLQRRQQQQQEPLLLLLPPERCEATAKALCSFLFPDLRPASPWLASPVGGVDLTEKETKCFAAVSSEEIKGGRSEWGAVPSPSRGRPLHARLGAQLRALDENLRPSGITASRQRKVHRLLVSWLKRKARWGAEWLGCGKAARRDGDNRLSAAPLLLPYGSSVSGFGAWASDLDLCLLLPSCKGASKKPQGRTSSLQRSKCCVDSEGKETETRYSSSSSRPRCCCCCCGCGAADRDSRGGGRGGRDASKALWSREAQADVLSRLKEELSSDPQMQSAFIDLEVVVPSSAPPVLRGVHLQRRRRRRDGARARRSMEVKRGGDSSKSLHILSPLAHSEEPRIGEDINDERDARDFQESGDSALLLYCSPSQPGDRGSESESGYSETSLAASSSSSDSQARGGLHQHREGTEQRHALNERSVPRQATHHKLKTTDSTRNSQEPLSQADAESSGQWGVGNIAVKFEVTVGSALGPLNSLLLRVYAGRCPLLPPLARIIKHWADCRGLTGTREGNLSSYAWSLLVIFFALSTSPPLLSSLQGPPFSPSSHLRGEGAPITRGPPLCRAPFTQMPVELICGRHNVWFLDPDSETPLGSRVQDLLRRVFRGSTESLLLQLVQRYVPGHVMLLPPAQRMAADCLQGREPQAALARLYQDLRGRGFPRRRRRRCLRDAELSEEEWQTLASLFHAFFAFYGFHFNCCALLVSLRSPPLCCKRPLNKWRSGSKRAERSKTPPYSAAAEVPPSSRPEVESLGAPHNSSLNCSCLPPCGDSTRDATPTEAAQKKEKKRGTKDALHARASSVAASPPVLRVTAEEEKWRLIVEGREHRGQREDLLRFLETQIEGIESARSSAFGIEVEDPIEAGRFLRFRKTKGEQEEKSEASTFWSPLKPALKKLRNPQMKPTNETIVNHLAASGSELFLHEVRRAEHLLRNGCSSLRHLFVGD
ncbi:hypothetical protein Esti_006203 [Eimeria stiedai]